MNNDQNTAVAERPQARQAGGGKVSRQELIKLLNEDLAREYGLLPGPEPAAAM